MAGFHGLGIQHYNRARFSLKELERQVIRRARDLETICRSGLCIGCGLCESVAGRDAVEMRLVSPGFLRPKQKAPIPPETMAKILKTCPGVVIDGDAAEDTALEDPVFGPGVSVWRGRAADDEVQFRAAAGGALTALGMYLLDHGKVDFVLHVGAARDAPMQTERKLSFSAGEVLDGTASRYGPAAPLVDVTSLLARGQRFAFIGKPCDVAALRNLARQDPRVDELVPYTLTISCAGVPKQQSSHEFLARHGLHEGELETMRYRGHGWPGPTWARARDGREAQESYLDMWFPYERKWKTQFRCKICPDHTGELADITSVDDWPGGAPEGDERVGRCLVVARTRAGDALFREAVKAGYLLAEPAPEGMQGMHDTQGHQVRKKQGILARLLAMWLERTPLPRYRKIRVLRAALTVHPMFHLRNLQGARRRLREGQHREEVPL